MRVAVPVALAVVVAAAALAPAEAAPKKKPPLKREYDVTLQPFPDPTEEVACAGSARTAAGLVHVHTLKPTGPGKLVVKVTGFTGDWDVAVHDASGKLLRQGWGSDTPRTTNTRATEDLWYRSTRTQPLTLRVCNVLGSERVKVAYTYTYS